MINIQRNWVAFETIARKECLRVLRIWGQSLLPSVMTMVLYFMIFGKLIGQRIGEMGGVSYIHYITPGLIMMAIITNSYTNVVSSFFGSKFQRNIEELLIAPIPNYVIIFGYISGGIMRGLLIGFLISLVAMFFGGLELIHPVITIFIGLITAVLFSLAGLINGIFSKKFDDVTLVPAFVLTPLTYLGGVFYSINLLPGWLQKVTYFNPIFHMVNAFRYGMLGTSDVSLSSSIFMLVSVTVFLYLVAHWLFARGIGLKT